LRKTAANGRSPEGLAVAGVVPREPQTPAELRSMWKEALGSAGRLIGVLLDAGGQLPRNELAARAGLTSNAGTCGYSVAAAEQ